jgi:hypothetical protein
MRNTNITVFRTSVVVAILGKFGLDFVVCDKLCWVVWIVAENNRILKASEPHYRVEKIIEK